MQPHRGVLAAADCSHSSRKDGVLLGLKAATESVAIPLSVLVAAEVLLPQLGYRGIFAMLAVSICLALLLLVRFVHVEPGPGGGIAAHEGREHAQASV